MQRTCDTVLRISPSKAEIVVEQEKKGVISRKLITPETLAKCFLSSRYDDETHATGLLPDGCISVVITPKHTAYYIRCPELYADICYYGTVYPDFPLPQLVFELRYMPAEGKIAKCRLCVVKDERLTMDTPTYRYPFSNIGFDGSIPVRDKAGLIQGMKIRLDDTSQPNRKYRWLSSRDKSLINGTRSYSWVHVTGDRTRKRAYITEGPLKGDVASFLAKDALFVCTGGINAIKGLTDTLLSLGVTEAVEAMDMDQSATRS